MSGTDQPASTISFVGVDPNATNEIDRWPASRARKRKVDYAAVANWSKRASPNPQATQQKARVAYERFVSGEFKTQGEAAKAVGVLASAISEWKRDNVDERASATDGMITKSITVDGAHYDYKFELRPPGGEDRAAGLARARRNSRRRAAATTRALRLAERAAAARDLAALGRARRRQ